MNTKLAAALAVAAATLLAATGCGDDSEARTKQWAEQVCDDIQPELRKVQQASTAISEASAEKDPAAVQEADAAAFDQISEAYAAMGRAIENAGVPPVDDGKRTQTAAVKELEAISKAYGDLKKTVEDLNVKDQGKFAAGLKSLAGDLQSLSGRGDEALRKLQAGELGEALSEEAGCQKPKGDSVRKKT